MICLDTSALTELVRAVRVEGDAAIRQATLILVELDQLRGRPDRLAGTWRVSHHAEP